MAIALEGAGDLLIITAFIVVCGLLIAVAYTFQRLAGVLDVSILGFHPFHGIANFLRNTIVHWCWEGVRHMEHYASDLLHGLAWQMDLMSRALHAIAVAVEHSLGLLRRHELPGLIRAAVHPLRVAIDAVRGSLDALWKHVANEVAALRSDIASAEREAIRTAERYTDAAIDATTSGLAGELAALRTTIEGELNTVAGELGAAEQTIAARLAQLENLIRDYGLPAALALLGITAAELTALEAETGLDQAACRSRVHDLCGIDPSIWADLLAGLALLDFGLSLRELVPPCRQAVSDLTGAVQALA